MKLYILAALLITICSSSGISKKQDFYDFYDAYGFDYLWGGVYDLAIYDAYYPFYDYSYFYGCPSVVDIYPYDCCYTWGVFCRAAFRKNDKSVIEKTHKKLEEQTKKRGENIEKKALKEALVEELKLVKKELVNNEEGSLEEYRNGKAYTKESLTREIQKSRILELEKLIEEKKKAAKK